MSSGFTYLSDLWGSQEQGYSNQTASGQLQGPLNVPLHRPPTHSTTLTQPMNQPSLSEPMNNPYMHNQVMPDIPRSAPPHMSPQPSSGSQQNAIQFQMSQMLNENAYLKNVVQHLAQQLEQAQQYFHSQKNVVANSPSSGGNNENTCKKYIVFMSLLFAVAILLLIYLFKQTRHK